MRRTAPERGVGRACRSSCRTQIVEQAAALLRDRRLRRRAKRGHGQPHQHDHADLLLRDLRRPAARAGHRRRSSTRSQDLRQARRGGRAAQLSTRSMRRSTTCTRWRCRPRRPRRIASPAAVPTAPDFVKHVTAVMIADQGDRLPVSAFPVDGTWPTGTTQWEKRNLATEIPVWDPIRLHPVQQVRDGLPARRDPRSRSTIPARLDTAPATFKSTSVSRTATSPADIHGAGGARGLHRLPAVREVCPAKDKSNPRHKAIDMAAQAPLREAERENYDVLPHAAGGGSGRPVHARRQEHAVTAAALRILGRVRRLRRDTVHQAA